jgi:uncharacterized protein
MTLSDTNLARSLLRSFAPPLLTIALFVVGSGCTDSATPPDGGLHEKRPMAENQVHYFEIPVTDMERAIAFYSAVFGYKLERTNVDGYDMATFPRNDNGTGASGALAKGDVYVPSTNGAIIYFTVEDIDEVVTRATSRGSKVLYPKKSIGELGFVAEIQDSEGNRIALHAVAE